MKVDIKIEGIGEEQIRKYAEIISVLLEKGALDGVRNGRTIIHFDGQGTFVGVQLDYFPWKRRRLQ